MDEWYCSKDKIKMEVANLHLEYRGLTQDVPGIRCPKCGEAYLLEHEVMTTVRAAESIFEGK
jgi:YgiT-type zinc finger domain-containing protein